MSDISGIYRIGPSYPVKPVQPVPKDRETDQRKKKKPQEEPEHEDRDDDDRKPIIDEHV